MKLTASVGKMGQNKKHDVAVVQAALMNVRGGPRGKGYWPGPIDGKSSKALTDALTSFQNDNAVRPANGTVQSIGPCCSKISAALPAALKSMQGVVGTTLVCVPPMASNQCRLAHYAEKSAPLPDKEAAGLAKIIKTLESSGGGCLELLSEGVNFQGNLMVELSFGNMQFLDNRSGKLLPKGEFPVSAQSELLKLTTGVASLWGAGGTKSLKLKTSLRLESLEKAPAVSIERYAAMKIEKPDNPIALKLVAAALYILDRNLLFKEIGKAELPLIYQALRRHKKELGLRVEAVIVECNQLFVDQLNSKGNIRTFAGMYEVEVAKMIIFANRIHNEVLAELAEALAAAASTIPAAFTANPFVFGAAVTSALGEFQDLQKKLDKSETRIAVFRAELDRLMAEMKDENAEMSSILARRKALGCLG